MLRGHLGEVVDAAFSPDGKLIASASTDGTVRFWNASAKPRQENFKPLPPDMRTGNSSWSLSPGGQWLFLIFKDHTFSLWNLNSWEESQRQPLPGDATTGPERDANVPARRRGVVAVCQHCERVQRQQCVPVHV